LSQYTHAELNNEIHSIAGYYCPFKEGRLPYDGREVLYVLGQATVDNSCCANGCWSYALVPGYILNWQNAKDASGKPVSEVEPIRDPGVQAAVRRTIQETAGVTQVDFR
jgi:hypothetical protein